MKHTPLVEKLIQSFTCLPGVGPRSAQRMAYALLERGRDDGRGLAAALNAAMDGVGPRELGLDVLEARLNEGQIQELILATGTTVEGEATAHYVLDLAREAGVSVTRIAQGVPMGGDLEFVDGATLAQALRGRRPFSS